jgi:cellulose synthase/poly-beta-1,6-N-acetylglucosamine synthase-like glycosyltransferase
MRTVVIAPIKNRAALLPYWLHALQSLQVPGEKRYVFYEDASDDDTRPLLRAFAEAVDGVTLIENDVPFCQATSSRDPKGASRQALYGHLASVRNILLDAAQDADAVLSIDSDILPAPGLVTALLSHDLPYVSTLVNNARTIRPADLVAARWSDPCNIMRDGPRQYRHLRPVPLNTLVPCTLSGACMLLRGEALDLRFAAHTQGEDGGMAEQAAQRNIPLFCDTTPRTLHIFHPADLTRGLETFTHLKQ